MSACSLEEIPRHCSCLSWLQSSVQKAAQTGCVDVGKNTSL